MSRIDMKQWRRMIRNVSLAASALAAGTLSGVSCGDFRTIAVDTAASINPCETIIDCDPVEFDLLFRHSDFPDFEECPVSVFPSDCVGVFPPTTGGGGGTTTTTTTTGTTGTTTGTTGTTSGTIPGF